jgi:uncharacterized membrane protein YkvA (DUF1232 family)
MRKNISEEEALGEIRKRMGKFSEKDLENVVKKGDKIKNKFFKAIPLKRFLEDFLLLFSLVKDYFNGVYLEVPWWTVASIGVALLYVLNPVDVIPDFIPGFGYIDDAAVIAVCLKMVEKDLKKYTEWKDKNGQ